MHYALPMKRDLRPRRPYDDPPSLAERAGCFAFVAMPLIFGIPVFRAWASVVGNWILYGYVGVIVVSLLYIIYLLERKEE
jgi:hypothetical protein